MRIDEVADHIGEHWYLGGSYRHMNGRVRLDGVTTVEQHYGYRNERIRKVRLVRVTYFDDEGAELRHDAEGRRTKAGGTPRTDLVEARELTRPWAEHWADVQIRQESVDKRRNLIRRLNAHLPREIRVVKTWGYGRIELTDEAASILADKLDQLDEAADEET